VYILHIYVYVHTNIYVYITQIFMHGGHILKVAGNGIIINLKFKIYIYIHAWETHTQTRRQMWQRRSKMRRVHARKNVTRLLRSTRLALSRGVRRGGGVIIVGRRRRRRRRRRIFVLVCWVPVSLWRACAPDLVRQSVFLLS
jgi:hypothetical protein